MPKKSKLNSIAPPEQGWGYVVCVAYAIVGICCYSHISSFGMLYNDFFVKIGSGDTGMTTVTGVGSVILSFAGIFTNLALKRFSLRQIGIFGAVSYSLGWFLNIFCTNLYQICFSIGVLQAIGFGILTTISLANLNTYFHVKRVMMMSIAQFTIGVGSMVCPIFIEVLLRDYGFRGTLLIMSGVVTHMIASVLCFQPVKWHAKRKLKPCIIKADDTIVRCVNDSNPNCNKELHEKDVLLTIDMSSLKNTSDIDTEYTKFKEFKAKEEITTIKPTMKSGIWKTIQNYLDLALLTNIIFINVATGISVGMFTDVCFFLMYPPYLYSLNYSTAQVAWSLSVSAGSDLLARACLAVISKFYRVNSRMIFYFAVLGSALSRFVIIQCRNYWSFMIVNVAMGFLRGLIMVPVGVIFAEMWPDNFAAAFGLSYLFMGAFNAIGYPLIGYMRDYTESYEFVFYMLSAVSLITIIPWTIEFLCTRKSQNISTVKICSKY